MKRSLPPIHFHNQNPMIKKFKPTLNKNNPSSSVKTIASVTAVLTDENLLYEVLRHVDAKTLGTAACVSRQWYQTAQDERLWEMICTQHSLNLGCGINQLRLVVLALGGFKCLHSKYLLPLSTKPLISKGTTSSSSAVVAATSTNSAWPCLPTTTPRAIIKANTASPAKTRWGKDEIQLSLSLLSIRYFEKLNFNNRNK